MILSVFRCCLLDHDAIDRTKCAKALQCTAEPEKDIREMYHADYIPAKTQFKHIRP